MPKRHDLSSVLILGAGPIVIGQACEFDYSGTQACKALREEGMRVILINSNPATIMTDPEMADATYIEPVEWRAVAKIIAKERPDAILPTMGGQTALNCALDLEREGVLKKYAVEMIGASREAIDKAEDRQLFGKAMQRLGLETPRSGLAHDMQQAAAVLEELGFPVVIRPSFTMGGSGGGIAYNLEEFSEICRQGLDLSPTSELLIDESIAGWKEYELEVVRDTQDNVIIICSIENLDPMGVHTGDSITVAPAQTLTDKEYQQMRSAAIAIVREIGVDTGGANVQFAVNPEDGRLVVIEMNPRVSRSSALASKATGFPIAEVAAKLAIGYSLDELSNKITGGATPASFEPTIDYVVTKIPRFNFEKFPGTEDHLTTQMKSVGEVMAFGRHFQESLQKALRGLEVGLSGLDSQLPLQLEDKQECIETLRQQLGSPSSQRLLQVADAMRLGMSQHEVFQITKIDPWFLQQIYELLQIEQHLQSMASGADDFQCDSLSPEEWKFIKAKGFSDERLACLLNLTAAKVREHRKQINLHPKISCVDTCAAEFPTATCYLYLSYNADEHEIDPQEFYTEKARYVVLGGGPNRIGQGIEFDYCCVHASQALRDLGHISIMINCNPETVSTDYDMSDRLYFESLTLEDCLEILLIEKVSGVVVQYGGQTPLKLAPQLEKLGIPIVGTAPDAIARAEDRERFAELVNKLELLQPPNGTVRSVEEGMRLAKVFAYPLVVRPSHVLGGRDMKIIYSEGELQAYMQQVSGVSACAPLLLDHFLDNAIEVDVDAIVDGQQVVVAGILEHIEQAGIHSGDSACCLPPHQLSAEMQRQLIAQVQCLGKELGVRGLMNVQFAIRNTEIFLLEVNPRASRTVPFIAKAIGIPIAKLALAAMLGHDLTKEQIALINSYQQMQGYYAVKQPVFPFNKFPGVDPMLGPEMRSTGEVMGQGLDFGGAYARAQVGAKRQIPKRGCAFLSVRSADKPYIAALAQSLIAVGFKIIATNGTAQVLQQAGVACEVVNKVSQGRPHVVDHIKNREVDFILNTVEGRQAYADAQRIRRSYSIRRSAIAHEVWYTTTLAGAQAACAAMVSHDAGEVLSLQQRYASLLGQNNSASVT